MPISHSGSYKVQEGIKTIAAGAFRNCKNINKIELPNSLKIIQASAFSKCSELESITIPANVTEIEDNAFFGCEKLHEIHFESATPAQFSAKAFAGIKDCIFFVANESLDAYLAALNGLDCTNIATITADNMGNEIIDYYGNYKETGIFNALNSSIDHFDEKKPLILDLTHISTLPEEAQIHTVSPNTILKANNSQSITNETNVCIDGICNHLVISDGFPFANDHEMTANQACYKRSMKNKWGTICLPFELTTDEHIRYYTTGTITDDVLSLISVTTVPAGTPAIFQRLDDNQLSLEAEDVKVTVSSVSLDGESSDIQLHGTYVELNLDAEDLYYIASDKFWRKTEGTPLTITPFRAWFNLSASKANNRTFSIEESENGAESIEAIDALIEDNAVIFDMNGHQYSNLQQGMNLILLSNGSYKKVLLK